MRPDQRPRNLPQLNADQVLIWRRGATENSFMPKHIPDTYGNTNRIHENTKVMRLIDSVFETGFTFRTKFHQLKSCHVLPILQSSTFERNFP